MPSRYGSASVELPSDVDILITRRFDAPQELLWECLTQPRHLLRWWGPSWCPLVACEVDLRAGGRWRYVARDTDGNELAWQGVYQAIEMPDRVVSTEVFEGFPDAESLNTMTLTHHDGVTTLQTLVRHSCREHRDAHIASGMEGGMQQTFDRLEDLLGRSDSTAERFRRVAGRFSDLVAQVPPNAWDAPAPCEGWRARDIVVHLTEWIPGFLQRADVVIEPGPSPQQDPVGAWMQLSTQLQALIDDPTVAARTFDAGPPGLVSVETAVGMFFLGDIFLHSWDLARATGGDERLDPTMCAEMLAGMEPMDEALRASGHYGPKVPIADDAPVQDKLVAFVGRRP